MNTKCSGHTLIELLIAMTLSIVLVGAVIPINNLGLKTAGQQQNVIQVTNQLRQAVKQIEAEIKSIGSTACLFDTNNLRDSLFTQPILSNNRLTQPWLAGNMHGNWYPAEPLFTNTNLYNNAHAIHLMFANLTESLSSNNLTTQPNRIFYITNCAAAEITRGQNSMLSTSDIMIYPFQSIIYYVREIDDKLILYRQYLSTSGNPRNEPLIDNIEQFKIAYAEKTGLDTLNFKSANSISDWNKVVAIYIYIEVQIENLAYSISRLIELTNINA